VKLQEDGRIVSVAVTIAVAVNTDGPQEVLGMAIGALEVETLWVEFLRRLKRRGLAGLKLGMPDAHRAVVGIFPNEAAITRLAGAFILDPAIDQLGCHQLVELRLGPAGDGGE
jgi:Transposase, Mutator family